MAVIGGRNVGTNDLAIMISGVVMFIVSFLPWYGVSFHGVARRSAQCSAGHSGRLVLGAAGDRGRRVCRGQRVFGSRSLPPVGNGAVSWGFILPAVSLLAAIIILLRWLTYPSAGITDSARSEVRHLRRSDRRHRADGLRLPLHRRRPASGCPGRSAPPEAALASALPTPAAREILWARGGPARRFTGP